MCIYKFERVIESEIQCFDNLSLYNAKHLTYLESRLHDIDRYEDGVGK